MFYGPSPCSDCPAALSDWALGDLHLNPGDLLTSSMRNVQILRLESRSLPPLINFPIFCPLSYDAV